MPFLLEQSPAAQASRQGDVSLGLGRVLSDLEARELYMPPLRVGQGAQILRRAPRAPRQHRLFYYDTGRQGLIGPHNVEPDPILLTTGGARRLELSVRSFHARSDNDMWNSVEDDLQLQCAVHTMTPEGRLSWVLLCAMEVFLQDGHGDFVTTLGDELRPTSEIQPDAQIGVSDGPFSLQIEVHGQKRRSIWKRLFRFGSEAAAKFDVLAIPKLVTQGFEFMKDALDAFHEESNLIPLLATSGLTCSISGGADYTLRPGYWVAIEDRYVLENEDQHNNLSNHKIDIPRQFFGIVDRNGIRVNADYLVFDLRFPMLSPTRA